MLKALQSWLWGGDEHKGELNNNYAGNNKLANLTNLAKLIALVNEHDPEQASNLVYLKLLADCVNVPAEPEVTSPVKKL